jgi:hypothetical protein
MTDGGRWDENGAGERCKRALGCSLFFRVNISSEEEGMTFLFPLG